LVFFHRMSCQSCLSHIICYQSCYFPECAAIMFFPRMCC
jgi:hypothetical protein